MALPTLLTIAKANGSDMVAGLIDETAKAHPELTGKVQFLGEERTLPNVGAARTIEGIMYKTLVRTGLPTVGFRGANQGVNQTIGVLENRTVETFILNPRWGADQAVADRHEDGPEALIALDAAAHMEASLQLLAKQFYYGTTGSDALGYPGLIQSYDATNMAVDATGTSAGTGSSVWAVKFGPRDVIWVWGNGGSMDPSDVTLRDMDDGNGKKFTGYHQELMAYPGVQVGSARSIGRIKKLTEENGKGLTDALIAKLLEKFEVGQQPDVLFMSRRSLRQLRDSRTATNPTGAPAPFPTEAFGIPIAPTDAILNTEDLAL